MESHLAKDFTFKINRSSINLNQISNIENNGCWFSIFNLPPTFLFKQV